MSLLGKIAALFSGSSARKVCVVDGDRLAGGDRIGPGERFQALSRLARFATREEMDVRVVFGGRPLREAEDGATYNGVQVYYGETPADVRSSITKAMSSAGRANAVLVTSDSELEAEMNDKGYASMRVGTLRKAMEPAGMEGGSREGGNGGYNGGRDRGDRGERGDRGDRDGGRRNRGRNRGRRPQGDRDQRENAPNQSSDNGNRPNDNPPSSGGGDSSVKNLIDLVE
jgi:hypothetical protein